MNQANWEYCRSQLINICRQEFQLVYFSNFSYGEIDELTPSERDTIYNFLIEQKDAEKKAHEENITKMKQQNSARRKH